MKHEMVELVCIDCVNEGLCVQTLLRMKLISLFFFLLI